jgi:hypothetical protein
VRRARIPAASAVYFLTLGGLAISPLAAIAGLDGATLTLVVCASLLAVHIGYGAITRTYWACAACFAVPLIALLLSSAFPDNDPDVDWSLAFLYGAVVVTPCVAALIAVGVAAGRRRSSRTSYR